MAKKKKQTRKKKVEEVVEAPSTFWPLAGAIILMVLALFLLLGGFGTGGSLPKGLFHGAYWSLGYAAYLAAPALVFLGVTKFTNEEKRIPLGKLVAMIVALALSASFFFTIFATKELGTITGGHGGESGRLIGSTVLGALDKWPASLVFLIVAMLAYFYALSISPEILTKLAGIFRKPEEDSDLATLKQKAGEPGFQLNEGVPVEHHSRAAANRLSSFRN